VFGAILELGGAIMARNQKSRHRLWRDCGASALPTRIRLQLLPQCSTQSARWKGRPWPFRFGLAPWRTS